MQQKGLISKAEYERALKGQVKPTEKKAVEVKPYGFLDLTAWATSSRFFGQDGPIYVVDENHQGIGASPRLSRIGVNITFPSIEVVKLRGNLELDMAGNYVDSGFAESRPMPMLRHAYIDVSKDYSGTVLGTKIGSTWSIVSPLNPDVLSLAFNWGLGNLWQRQPQIQVYLNQKAGDSSFGIALAAVRPMTGNSIVRNTFFSNEIDAGEASQIPMFQGEVHADVNMGDFKLFLSGSGMWSRRDYNGATSFRVGANNVPVTGPTVDAYVGAGSAKIGNKSFAIQGEGYYGRGADTFGAELGSGVSFRQVTLPASGQGVTVLRGLETKGGWAQLTLSPVKELNLHGGCGMDEPEDDVTSVTYKRNRTCWGSAFYTVLKQLTFGVMYQHIRTNLAVGGAAGGTAARSYQERIGNYYAFSTRLNF